jgi:cell division protein FtsI (penicillin-binding protein 3)
MNSAWRLRVLVTGYFVAMAIILFRVFQLQMIPHQNVENLARRQLLRTTEIVGRRGTIYDRNGRELAVSMNSVSVYANPQMVTQRRRVARVLGAVLRTSPEQILKKLSDGSHRKFIWLERQLTTAQVAQLEKLNLKSLEGIGVIPEYRREYPMGELAAHVLGFVSIDGWGLEGVEKRFDETLRGNHETLYLERDARGRPIFTQLDQIRLNDQRGENLRLTIDARLQYAAEIALKKTVSFHAAESASAIVMDPHSGEILAMANYPGFDPEKPGNSPMSFRRNRAITDPVEPGSVMKSFVVAKALDDGIITPNTWVDGGNGFIKIGKKTIGEAEENHRFGKIQAKDLIKYSSNVATVNLKNLMGFDRVADIFEKEGFGQMTGLDLPGESRGILKIPSKKQLLEQATISFGQGMAATPIQIVSAYASIANGGRKVIPTLIERLEENRPEPPRVMREETAAKMKKILASVVQDGTGVAAQIEGFEVAGKTGTAQMVDFTRGGYERGAYWASFVGFFPASSPRFVVYVLVSRPTQNGFYGGPVAAPIFAEIARAAARTVGLLPRSMAKNHRESPTYPESFDESRRSLLAKNSLLKARVMPNLQGLTLSQAMRVLQETQPSVEVMGRGTQVIEQIPAEGESFDEKQRVYLKVR